MQTTDWDIKDEHEYEPPSWQIQLGLKIVLPRVCRRPDLGLWASLWLGIWPVSDSVCDTIEDSCLFLVCNWQWCLALQQPEKMIANHHLPINWNSTMWDRYVSNEWVWLWSLLQRVVRALFRHMSLVYTNASEPLF